MLPQRQSWRIKILQGEWPKIAGQPDTLFESSTIAEPRAIEKVLELKPFPENIKHVLFISDHSPLVAAAQSCQSRCYTYFQVLSKLEREHYTYNLLFIKGSENVADGPSRGRERNVERHELESIAAGAGTGYASALLSPSKEILPHVVGFI